MTWDDDYISGCDNNSNVSPMTKEDRPLPAALAHEFVIATIGPREWRARQDKPQLRRRWQSLVRSYRDR